MPDCVVRGAQVPNPATDGYWDSQNPDADLCSSVCAELARGAPVLVPPAPEEPEVEP